MNLIKFARDQGFDAGGYSLDGGTERIEILSHGDSLEV